MSACDCCGNAISQCVTVGELLEFTVRSAPFGDTVADWSATVEGLSGATATLTEQTGPGDAFDEWTALWADSGAEGDVPDPWWTVTVEWPVVGPATVHRIRVRLVHADEEPVLVEGTIEVRDRHGATSPAPPVAPGPVGDHPGLAGHDALGLATDAEVAAAVDAHESGHDHTPHPDLAGHEALGLASGAAVDEALIEHLAAADHEPHPGLAGHEALGLARGDHIHDPAAPAPHAATHAAAGPDPVTPAAIGAAPTVHAHDDLHDTQLVADAGASLSLVFADAPADRLVVATTTVDCEVSVAGIPPSGTTGQVSLLIDGPGTVTFAPGIVWLTAGDGAPDGTATPLAVSFLVADGATVYGFVGGVS